MIHASTPPSMACVRSAQPDGSSPSTQKLLWYTLTHERTMSGSEWPRLSITPARSCSAPTSCGDALTALSGSDFGDRKPFRILLLRHRAFSIVWRAGAKTVWRNGR
eukprot:scaffold19141_cov66-Phaeocystis_antarctica.AAC.3